jgi:exosortase
MLDQVVAARLSTRLGPIALICAIFLSWVLWGRAQGVDETSRLSPPIFAAVLLWLAAFLFCYGMRSFKSALFALCCLFLAIPAPPAWMDRATIALQHGSADVSEAMFRLFGIPVFRQGMTFSLPGLDVEVAPQCSGIRGCLVFMIAGILMSRVFLHSAWRRVVLVTMIVPIAIVKNAVRIVVISTLSAYVNRAFLFGSLHHYGGLAFLFVGVGIFLPLLFALRRSEVRYSNWQASSKSSRAFRGNNCPASP